MTQLRDPLDFQRRRFGSLPRVLTPDEEARLFAAIGLRSSASYALSVFLIDTGARLSEVLGIAWADINGCGVTFRSVGGERTIPLTRRAYGLAVRREAEGGPFHDIKVRDYRETWKRAKADAGLTDPKIVPHILRNTCAGRLVMGGIDLRLVQKWMGHRSPHITMRYASLASPGMDDCVRVLEARDRTLD